MTDREQFNASVMGYGNSLAINCTKALRRMGLDRGDMVRVTLERVPGDEAPDKV